MADGKRRAQTSVEYLLVVLSAVVFVTLIALLVKTRIVGG